MIAMLTKRSLIAGAALAALFAVGPARGQEKLKVVASFSILGDLVKNVGGDRVEVSALVGPNGDVHVFEPSPADAKKVADANVVVVNGLGLEGWLDRLIAASGTKARIIVATKGIKPRDAIVGRDRVDPHAWQSVANAMTYIANIRDGLIAADPANEAVYETNAAAYLIELAALDRDIRAAIAKIPPDRRRVVTSHRAFGYFEDAYGTKFDAPQGISGRRRTVGKRPRRHHRENPPAEKQKLVPGECCRSGRLETDCQIEREQRSVVPCILTR